MRFLLVVSALVVASAAGCGDDDRDLGAAEDGERPQVSASADALLSRDPYMGVSCRTPNSIACDRVGLAVWLREPAVRVDAEIAGRALELDDPDWSEPANADERRMFAGFLEPAGLFDGPLEVTPDAGPDRWIGRKPVSATVDLRIIRNDGTATTTTLEVPLSPGWG